MEHAEGRISDKDFNLSPSIQSPETLQYYIFARPVETHSNTAMLYTPSHAGQ